MAASIERCDRYTVVRHEGDIRVKDVITLRKVLETLEDERPLLVAFDFSGVGFVDSSGVGLLMNFARRVVDRGGQICIYGADSSVAELLDVAGVAEAIPLYASRDEVDERA